MHPQYSIACLALALILSALRPGVAQTLTMSTAPITTKQGCPRKCGNVTIPYPFGIGLDRGCSLNSYYDVFCNLSSNPNTPFLVARGAIFSGSQDGLVELLEISEQHVRVRNTEVAIMCFNSSGQVTTSDLSASYFMLLSPNSPFAFPSASNLLTVIGCQDSASISDGNTLGGGTTGACSSKCPTKSDVVAGQCNGSGCCQASIPRGLRGLSVVLGLESNNTNILGFSPCGYAFVAEQGRFNFSGLPDLNDPAFVQRVIETVPVAVDWVIGNGTCEQARRNPSTYACKENTKCSDNLDNGIGGYKCFCNSGFQGHPYLSPGCYADIDECADPKLNNCSKTCVNTIGSFRCTCPRGYTGDGRTNATGCVKKNSQNFVLKLCLGISSGVLFLVIGSSWLYVMDRKTKLIQMKREFFERNGGWLLQERLSTEKSVSNTDPAKIFTEAELKEATNNFDKDQVVGNGGYGTVYKGILPNNQVVAIKKSKVVDQNQIQQFINEVVILGQVNHRNVVKLLGCCLETEVPLLVYEFISNGTLYSHIHESHDEKGKTWRLTWNDCLQIASEAANALAYLHSAASPPVIHRDVKSMNILLDDDYTAKIADFGASRLIPMDQSQLSTLVQGTLGYLDPEYFHSSVLTDKSDVYSFGVVLAELLTRQKPLTPFRAEENRNLATFFVKSFEQETLFDIVDPQWLNEASASELVSMASITQRCLRLSNKERPSMKEVSMELEAIKKMKALSHLNQTREKSNEDPKFLNLYNSSKVTEVESTISVYEETDLYPILRRGG